jgi:hypothetical protein
MYYFENGYTIHIIHENESSPKYIQFLLMSVESHQVNLLLLKICSIKRHDQNIV